eukprot:Hpha_TRINITY_DN15544_c2_g10::TRINITY_DN15544_c2_g10_i1::g.108159::m.108159
MSRLDDSYVFPPNANSHPLMTPTRPDLQGPQGISASMLQLDIKQEESKGTMIETDERGCTGAAATREDDGNGSEASGSEYPQRENSEAKADGVVRDSFGGTRPARSARASEKGDDDAEMGQDMSMRMRINILFTDPSSSFMAQVITVFFMLLIVLSTISFLLETVPELSADKDFGDPSRECMWFVIESIFVAFFTFEYVIRWVTEPVETIIKFPLENFNVIDLIAIAPYYFELILSGFRNPCIDGGPQDGGALGLDLRFLRVVRLARVFRVMKLGRNLNATKVLTQTFSRSRDALTVPFFFLLLGMIVFSSLIYLVEQGTYNTADGRYYITNSQGSEAEARFPSIPDALWWAIVTMTTVGYGDVTPQTALGKAINSMAMMFGVLFFAMPIAIIGTEFTVAWEENNSNAKDKSKYANLGQRELQLNTKAWGGDELNFFNIAFSERNLTLQEFFGFEEIPEDCRLDINVKGWFTQKGVKVTQEDALGMVFKHESVQHSGTLENVRDDGLVLHRMESSNAEIVSQAACKLMGRRLLKVTLGAGGAVLDFTDWRVLETWIKHHPRGDKGSWADGLLRRHSSLSFQFETEQQAGDRVMRYAPAELLVPEHFNASVFAHHNGRHIEKSLSVPSCLAVVSESEEIEGVYQLSRERYNRNFKWVRFPLPHGPAEPRSPGAGSRLLVLVSDFGKWTVREFMSGGRGALDRPEGDEGLRTQGPHRGNLPDKRYVWEQRTSTPRRRWVSSPLTAVREVPRVIELDSEDVPSLNGSFSVTSGLRNHNPQWVRYGPGTMTILYWRFSERNHQQPGAPGRWVVECVHTEVDSDSPNHTCGHVLRSGETADKFPQKMSGWQCCEGPESGWDLEADYERVGWRYHLGKMRVNAGDDSFPPNDSLINFANKVFHVQRASRHMDDPILGEKNMGAYTKDLIAQLFNHVGMAKLPTGFRSRAGLKVYFGSPDTSATPKEISSDSDVGLFGIAPGKVVPVYAVANQALLSNELEKKGRIAGELLAVAQSFWLQGQKRNTFDLPVYLITFRGTLVRFYSAVFSGAYLEAITSGREPEDHLQIRVHSFPNRKQAGEEQRRFDHVRRNADDVFADTRREPSEQQTTAFEWTMHPHLELQDGKLQYQSMPRIEDYGGSTELRVVGVSRNYHGGVKVGMRLLKLEDLRTDYAGKHVTITPSTKSEYDKFIRERARAAEHAPLETIRVRATFCEETDALDLIRPAERAVVVEVLQRLRLRVMRYLHDELDDQFSFSPVYAAACRRVMTMHEFGDACDPIARQEPRPWSPVASGVDPGSPGRDRGSMEGGMGRSFLGKLSSALNAPLKRVRSRMSEDLSLGFGGSRHGSPVLSPGQPSSDPADELRRLRAENARLRRQLDPGPATLSPGPPSSHQAFGSRRSSISRSTIPGVESPAAVASSQKPLPRVESPPPGVESLEGSTPGAGAPEPESPKKVLLPPPSPQERQAIKHNERQMTDSSKKDFLSPDIESSPPSPQAAVAGNGTSIPTLTVTPPERAVVPFTDAEASPDPDARGSTYGSSSDCD